MSADRGRLADRTHLHSPIVYPLNRPEVIVTLAQRTHLNLESLSDRIVPAVVDLTTFGSSAFLGNGTVVHRNDSDWGDTHGDASEGLGDLNSFVSLTYMGLGGVEQGYNTDARPVEFNEAKEPAKTHSIRLSDLPVVTVNGTQYREFVLNVNQKNNARNLSVDEARVFLGSVGNLSGYNSSFQTLAGQTAVWDLDAGEDTTIITRALMNQGSLRRRNRLARSGIVLHRRNRRHVRLPVLEDGRRGGAVANGGAEQWGYRLPPLTQPPTEGGTLSGFVYQVSAGWTPGDTSFLAIEGATINLVRLRDREPGGHDDHRRERDVPVREPRGRQLHHGPGL